jgi:HK97 family phage prohead protease
MSEKENMIFRGATIDTSKEINEEERRVPVVISTEAPITVCEWNRRNYETDCYPQILVHSDESVVINRAIVKLLHNHNSYALPIGRLENIRVEEQKLKADAIFSKSNPDAEVPWAMVQEGTLDEISVGGIVIEKSEVRDADDKITQVNVTKWELLEASLVTIAADANAGVNRNLQQGEELNLKEIRREIQSLKAKIKESDDDAVKRGLVAEQDKLEREALQLELDEIKRERANDKRKEKILFLARKHNIGESDEMVQRFLDNEKKTEQDFGMELLERMENSQVKVGFQRGESGDQANITRAISDSLLLRAGYPLADAHQDVNRYATASLLDIARVITGMGDNFNRDETIKRAMTTAQFPNMLLGVAQRVLEQSWDEVESTYQLWTQVEYFNDFRPKQYVDRKSLLGTFDKVSEGGERKYVSIGEDGRSWAIDSYGEKILFTRKMLINDDLGALLDIVKDIVAKAKRTINTHVYDLKLMEGIYKDYKMGDNKAIFHADHKNLGTAGALSEDTLTVLDTMMGEQIETDGKEKISLNITPEFLIVGRKNRLLARKLLGSTASIDGKNSGVVNPFNSLYTLVEEQRMKDAYSLAAKNRTISVGFLAGNTSQMPIIEMTNKGLDGIEFNIELDFGVSASDFRGMALNKGK